MCRCRHTIHTGVRAQSSSLPSKACYATVVSSSDKRPETTAVYLSRGRCSMYFRRDRVSMSDIRGGTRVLPSFGMLTVVRFTRLKHRAAMFPYRLRGEYSAGTRGTRQAFTTTTLIVEIFDLMHTTRRTSRGQPRGDAGHPRSYGWWVTVDHRYC